jgi:hypothetical protein
MKRGVLVTPKDHWPPHEGGLSMEYLGEALGCRRGGVET